MDDSPALAETNASPGEWSWSAMLDAFRALGGTADNVEQRPGPYGHGLFPIDPQKPVDVRVPERMLVAYAHIHEDGPDLVIDPAAGFDADVCDFFTRYQRAFSWGRDGRENAKAWFAGLASLPLSVQKILTEKLNVRVPPRLDDPALLLPRFLETRVIRYRGRNVAMPVMELVNHASIDAPRFDTRDGIRVAGTFPGEVLVVYNAADALRRYFDYGFVCNEHRAYSLPLTLTPFGKWTLVVSCDLFAKQGREGVGSLLPIVTVEEDRLKVSSLLLGSEQRPRVPRSVFRRAVAEHVATETADEAFDRVAGANLVVLVAVLDELDGCDSAMARDIRAVVRLQITALGYRFGARDLDSLPLPPEPAPGG
jgi:hypothetical protein